MKPPVKLVDSTSPATDEVRELLRSYRADAPRIPPPFWLRPEAQTPREGALALPYPGLLAGGAALVGLALVVGIGSGYWAQSGFGVATVVEVDGVARVNGQPSRVGQSLFSGANLDAQRGRVVAKTSRADVLRFERGGRFRLDDHDRVAILSGLAQFEVRPRRPGERHFMVTAGAWRISVLGTRFSVERSGSDLQVKVKEGRVRVLGPDVDRILGSGQSFDCCRPMSVRPSESPEPQSSGLARRGSGTPTESAKSPEQRKDRTHTKTTTKAVRQYRRAPSSRRVRLKQRRPRKAEVEASSPEVSQPSLLAKAKATSDLSERLRLLDQVVALGQPLDEIAAFQAAQTAAQAGRLEQAVRRYAAFVERWPQGELVPEALLEQAKIELRRHKEEAASRAAHRYERVRPEATKDPSFRFLKAEIERALSHWLEAAELYGTLVRESEFREQAMFLRAVCLGQAGHTPEARNEMELYLEEFPDGAYVDVAREALGWTQSRHEGNPF